MTTLPLADLSRKQLAVLVAGFVPHASQFMNAAALGASGPRPDRDCEGKGDGTCPLAYAIPGLLLLAFGGESQNEHTIEVFDAQLRTCKQKSAAA